MLNVVIWGLTLLTAVLTYAAQPEQNEKDEKADPLEPLAFLVGEWRGLEEARFGKGAGEREYRFILNGRYLLSQNASAFEPQEGLPEGDRHEDWTIFSYDQGRHTVVIRQFNSEGFVNRFVLDASSEMPTKMVFLSEASENSPPGLRARLTYEKVSDDELHETFELAMPGEDFGVLVRNRWTRVSR